MTPSRETLIANLLDLEQRREAERLYMASLDATTALSEAQTAKDLLIRDREDAVNARAAAERKALYDERDNDPSIAALKAAMDAADAAWMQFEALDDIVMNDDYDAEKRCTLTGLLIHECDQVMTDERTGEIILKAALGIPLNEDGEFEIVNPDQAEQAA